MERDHLLVIGQQDQATSSSHIEPLADLVSDLLAQRIEFATCRRIDCEQFFYDLQCLGIPERLDVCHSTHRGGPVNTILHFRGPVLEVAERLVSVELVHT